MEWVLTIGIDKFNLTAEEKERYLTAVNQGAKYVQIRGMILGSTFQTLVQKEVLDGRWECEYGKWHKNGTECYCGSEFIEKDGKYIEIEKPNKDLKAL